MRIEIRTSGGFAGLRRPPLVLDTAELDPATAGELEALASRLPAAPPPGRGADLMTYAVTIDDARGRRTIAYTEPAVPEDVRALLRRARAAGDG